MRSTGIKGFIKESRRAFMSLSYSTEQLALEVQGSLGVPTVHQLLVHHLDNNLPIVNLSSMERHQFQLHIMSVRPDKV